MWALTSEAIMLTGDTMVVTSGATLGFEGRRPLRPFRLSVLTTGEKNATINCYFQFSVNILILHHSSGLVLISPSLTMPTTRHFWKRQNWHRFRLLLSTGQSLLARQTYLEFFWTVRCEIKRGITLNVAQSLAQNIQLSLYRNRLTA